MKIVLKRINQAFHFEAGNSEGHLVQIDGSPEIGGEGKGMRPMELLLVSLGGCASIDFGLILKKQKQELTSYQVELSGERSSAIAKEFTSINLQFVLGGKLVTDKVEKAIHLTVNKYCSAIKSLNPAIDISYSYTINEAR